MKKHLLKQKIRLLPNVITAFGLSCGLFVIFKMSMMGPFTNAYDLFVKTAAIIILAAFADLLDGAVARAMKAESEFGGLFDSLADAISFGVAPTVIVIHSFLVEPGSFFYFLLITSSMIFSMSGVLRLVRFSVMKGLEKEDEEKQALNKKNFTGLPIPAAAGALISLNLFLLSPDLQLYFPLVQEERIWILFFTMTLLGYLMVSRLKFPSLKSFELRIVSFQLVFFTVLAAVFFVYGVVHHFSIVFFIVSWAYVLIALFLSAARYLAGRRLKSLEDFDLDPEDLDFE